MASKDSTREDGIYLNVRQQLSQVPDNPFIEHAKRELGPREDKEEGPDLWMHDALLAQIRLFSLAGHSGMSAAINRSMLMKLLDYKPLGPLTGAPDEWIEVEDKIFQNRRCSTVFRQDGRTHDIDGFVFVEPSGCAYTGYMSRRYLTLPCLVPERVEVDVPEGATDEQRRAAILAMGIPEEEIMPLHP